MTKDKQHTEGPWFIEDDPCNGDPNYFKAISADSHSCLAEVVYRMEDDSKIDLANAHLIAAAPDLLEALESIITITDRKHIAWDRAHVAIAKARGEGS